ncbi:AbiTii domain-containing protein [Bacillus luti]|uniref:AbiTii domain-containing protein n=1 Tax=Bacillus luti TaxID=2026191 RepID=UPI003773A469
MARSKLLLDVVSGRESLENIFFRLKVILSDLDNQTIMNWIQGELQGYKSGEEIPTYRILSGSAVGTYVINNAMKYTDAPVPLENLLEADKIGELKTVPISDGIGTLQDILNGENREKYAMTIPTSYCHAISTRELQLMGMRIKIGSNQLNGIVSHVKSKLIEVIMELEKQFDNLDDLDIKSQVEDDTSKKDQVTYNIEQILYDSSIQLGDKNKLSRSILGHFFGGDKK